MKKFTKWEIATIKGTAKNMLKFVKNQEKLSEKIANLQLEIDAIQKTIDAFETPVMEITGGYRTSDLLVRSTNEEGKTVFELKYPETVIPVEAEEVVEELNNAPVEESNEESIDDNPPIAPAVAQTEWDEEDADESFDSQKNNSVDTFEEDETPNF